MTWLIAGLGNPGPRYAQNRHNIGFMIVDALGGAHGRGAWRTRFVAETMDAEFGKERVLLMKPMTYMNDSGQAVGEALRYLKIPVEKLIVIHDELDLARGKVRIKNGGGDAGHNGLKSITAHCGPYYKRVRIGIGHPGEKSAVHSHVLKDFAKEDEAWVAALCDVIAKDAALLLADDDSVLMNRIDLAVRDKIPQDKIKEKENGL
ncbi:MAG: aminoacyl-tRNA hydrolase [Pseudomonadota bacterium]